MRCRRARPPAAGCGGTPPSTASPPAPAWPCRPACAARGSGVPACRRGRAGRPRRCGAAAGAATHAPPRCRRPPRPAPRPGWRRCGGPAGQSRASRPRRCAGSGAAPARFRRRRGCRPGCGAGAAAAPRPAWWRCRRRSGRSAAAAGLPAGAPAGCGGLPAAPRRSGGSRSPRPSPAPSCRPRTPRRRARPTAAVRSAAGCRCWRRLRCAGARPGPRRSAPAAGRPGGCARCGAAVLPRWLRPAWPGRCRAADGWQQPAGRRGWPVGHPSAGAVLHWEHCRRRACRPRPALPAAAPGRLRRRVGAGWSRRSLQRRIACQEHRVQPLFGHLARLARQVARYLSLLRRRIEVVWRSSYLKSRSLRTVPCVFRPGS